MSWDLGEENISFPFNLFPFSCYRYFPCFQSVPHLTFRCLYQKPFQYFFQHLPGSPLPFSRQCRRTPCFFQFLVLPCRSFHTRPSLDPECILCNKRISSSCSFLLCQLAMKVYSFMLSVQILKLCLLEYGDTLNIRRQEAKGRNILEQTYLPLFYDHGEVLHLSKGVQ